MKKRVNAEKFEAVTIYYSDLVEFTDLYSESTPVEVQFFETSGCAPAFRDSGLKRIRI